MVDQVGGRLAGKVAIITGGASGIGEATCRLFARQGASVMIADLSAERADALAKEINSSGGKAASFALDVSEEKGVVALVERTEEVFGRIDILINSAGITLFKFDVDITSEEWDRVMGVNVKGAFLTIKHTIPRMKKTGGGSIVNIASIVANSGWAGYGAYSASKGALRALTKASAIAHGREGIRVNSVNPGIVRTPMTENLFETRVERFERGTPLGRFGEPMDIANCCLFLASDESAYVLGAELTADGGLIA